MNFFFAKIKIGNNLFYANIRIQLPIKFIVVGHTIHCAQGFTFDHLAFELNGIMKHDLKYTTLFQVYSKKNIYILHCQTKINSFI